MAYTILFYTTERGDSPVKEFIGGLDSVTRAKFISYIELLIEQGPNLKRPYADTVGGKIRELRPRQARVLYFFAFRDNIVLVHGFLKKRREIEPAEFAIAQVRMANWIKRKNE